MAKAQEKINKLEEQLKKLRTEKPIEIWGDDFTGNDGELHRTYKFEEHEPQVIFLRKKMLVRHEDWKYWKGNLIMYVPVYNNNKLKIFVAEK